jgi:hypothetical protein
MAARIEFEYEFLDKFSNPKPEVKNTVKKTSSQEKAYKQLGSKNPNLADMLKNL